MRLLLDTHSLLWFFSGDPKLPAGWRAAICDPANDVFTSVACIWEAVIKYRTGKLPLPGPPEQLLPAECLAQSIDVLDVTIDSVRQLATLPPVHRDPFDRILVAQALQHDLTVVTVDADIRAYPVKLLPP